MNKFLIVILGPTGVGKSELSVHLAEHFNTAIISADSRQFYSEMRIGTAAPSDDLLKRIDHYFVRCIRVREYYSANLFERDVLELLENLFKQRNIILMTGGSGLYIDAVCDGLADIPDVDPAIRQKYNERFRDEGIESLRNELRFIDPEYYLQVDLRNHKRLIRALEVYATTGKKYSDFLSGEKTRRDFRIVKIGLTMTRAELYGRINSRVDEMIKNGLEDEARSLFDLRHLNPLRSVGYTELFDYFEGKTTREQAIGLIKRNSRRYAKRQMTWWRRDERIKWFDPRQSDEIIKHIESIILK